MRRYLVRIPNRDNYTPGNIKDAAEKIRTLLGSSHDASHFRISKYAIEFNLFINTMEELNIYQERLEREYSQILLVKPLDEPGKPLESNEAIREGVELFNEERFWEAHEILEHVWKESSGQMKDSIQGIILVSAAFVHYQKGENSTALSILARAKEKLKIDGNVPRVDLHDIRSNVDRILSSGNIIPFKIAYF